MPRNDGPLEEREAIQQSSWIANAEAWTAAVRGGEIASRKNGTDAAILEACRAEGGMRVLDVGCGEGWLARGLATSGASVVGVDASAPLIDAARAATGAATGAAAGDARYDVVDYDTISRSPHLVSGPFDLIVCNFALLDHDLVPLLRALRERLAPQGRVVIQTVHPCFAAGEEGYQDGWREERFAAFGGGFSAPMPWYFRTMQSWSIAFAHAGLAVRDLREPRSSTGAVLSVIFECGSAEVG